MNTSRLHPEKFEEVYATFYFTVVCFCICMCLWIINIRKSTTLKLCKLERISRERQSECTLPCEMHLPPTACHDWGSNGTLSGKEWNCSVFKCMAKQSLEKNLSVVLHTDHSLSGTVKTDVLFWGISTIMCVWTYIEIWIFTTFLMFLVLFIWHSVLFLLLFSWHLDLLFWKTSAVYFIHTHSVR